LKNRQRLHIHHAGREVLGRIVLLDAEELGGDAGPRTGLCQLHLEAPLVARRDDRLVLRFYSPLVSIGGGVVLDVAPRRHRRFDDETLDQLAVREQGDPEAMFRQRLRAAEMRGLACAEEAEWLQHPEAIVVGGRIYDREVLAAEANAIRELVADYAGRFPLRLGIGKEEVRRRRGFTGGAAEWNALCQALAPLAGWVVTGGRLAATDEGPALAPALAEAVARRERAVAECGLQWPGLDAFAERVSADESGDRQRSAANDATSLSPEEFLRHLVDRGRAVQIGSDYFVHRDALAALTERLREYFAREAKLSFAGFRDLSGLTRKLGIPMLEYLDQTGITVRTGDARVAGPHLGGASADT
jgi:selenocysteine-specific elongation factor